MTITMHLAFKWYWSSVCLFFVSSRRRHTRFKCDWSSDVCSSDLLLTDDGDLANRLTHPRYEVPKTYIARVERGPVSERALRQLREGVQLDDGMTAPAGARQLRPGVLELTLREGRKRQVRRMCAAVGHPVRRLSRVAFGPLPLGDLGEGGVRRLTRAEVQRLRDAAAPPGRAPA